MILYLASKSGSSWSLRPWILMRELRIAFEERVVPFAPGSSYDRFREFSPTGRLPCLLDGDDAIWDSLAIVEHLAERHPGVWPDDRRARSWARSASAEMHSGFAALRQTCPMTFAPNPPIALPREDLARDIARLDDLWTEGLSRFGGPFLTGDRFTAVDAFFTPVAFRFRAYGLRAGSHAMAYVERLLQLDGMKEWHLAAAEEVQQSAHGSSQAAGARRLAQK